MRDDGECAPFCYFALIFHGCRAKVSHPLYLPLVNLLGNGKKMNLHLHMLRRTIEIIVSSFKMAVQELWKNKLRTFLSLFGITIGIFCIIGVLATVNSLEQNIQNEIK